MYSSPVKNLALITLLTKLKAPCAYAQCRAYRHQDSLVEQLVVSISWQIDIVILREALRLIEQRDAKYAYRLG